MLSRSDSFRGPGRKHSFRFLAIGISLILCLFSLLILRPMLSSVETYHHEMEELDEKRNTVLSLVGASTVTSAIISAIPDDTATPIANQLAEYSTLFLFITAVLISEKYLLTVFVNTGTVPILTNIGTVPVLTERPGGAEPG